MDRTGQETITPSPRERHRARYLAETRGFRDRFDQLFFSCHLGCAKPDASFFEEVTYRLELQNDQILFLDDLSGNVDAARKVGWHAEQVTNADAVERAVSSIP